MIDATYLKAHRTASPPGIKHLEPSHEQIEKMLTTLDAQQPKIECDPLDCTAQLRRVTELTVQRNQREVQTNLQGKVTFSAQETL